VATQLRFVDAAFASSITGGPYDGVCFYTGGDAYHVWPVADLDSRPEQYRLPIWVRSDPGSVNPADDARSCVASLRAYGVPAGALVALDSETSIDAAWTKTFVETVNSEGHPVIDYGSQSDVMSNENPDGYYWGADWTNVPHLHSGDQMTQYVSFQNEDVSEAELTLPFWNTRPAPKPAPTPMKGNVVLIVHVQGNPAVYLWNGTSMSHITSVDNEVQFKAAGIQSVEVTADQFAEMAGAPPLT
jgi:hypothetical protein